MQIERVSEECIKSSSPTTAHLKTYKLSLLDQIVPSNYFSLILFYPNQETSLIASNDFISKRSLLLKQSLSETLSRFYPVSGRIKDNLAINCNDGGVCYVEARANVSLSEYLRKPDLSSLEMLLPEDHDQWPEPTPESHLAMIQGTTFACGGFSIAILASHIIFDATALCSFLKDWAVTTCKSDKEILRPFLDSPSIFLQHGAHSRLEASILGLWVPFIKKMRINSRRFLFDVSAIASLKEKAISLGIANPTRVEVVTALFVKRLMTVSKAKSGVDKPLAMTHAVNLRKKAVPPFAECSLGNFILPAAAVCRPKEAEFSSIVWQLKEAIGKINSHLVEKLQGDAGFVKLYEIFKETGGVLSGGLDYVTFDSWCNLGLYDIDFGWGKPVWTTSAASGKISEIVFANLVMLMDTREDKGIEALAILDEEDLLLLEKDKELLQYACVDPIPWTSELPTLKQVIQS